MEDGPPSTHGRKNMHTKFWWEAVKEKDPIGGSKHRWEDNIKIDLKEIGWQDVDWIYLVQNRDLHRSFVDMIMNLRIP
jgi:hypothetical protein